MTYIKDKNATSSPLLQKQISMFNNISKWVIAMVLQKETPMARARLFKKFIQICRVSIHFSVAFVMPQAEAYLRGVG